MSLDTTGIELRIAECYSFTLNNGVTAYFTSHDTNITFLGETYQAIPIKRSQVSYHSDLQVDKVDIDMGLVGITVGTASYTIPQIIRREFLRNANVLIHLVDYVTPTNYILLFEGWVTGDISYNEGIMSMSVGSLLDKLNEKFPKLIYSEFCNHQLYSSYCDLIKDNHKATGTVTVDVGSGYLVYADIFDPTVLGSKFVLGEIKFTSGANNGVSRTIKEVGSDPTGHACRVIKPFFDTITVGDTFDVWYGCDKTLTSCKTRFEVNNVAHFLGFPFIPKPETLYG
jgi:uncharacterized phage protein (TIGR02218 family)